MELQASGREVEIYDVLKYELAPVTMAMFDSAGDMRVAKTKSTLKRRLQVEPSNRHTDQDSRLIVYASAVLWVIPWPAQLEKKSRSRQGSDLVPQEGSIVRCLLWYSSVLGTPDRMEQADSIALR